MTGEPTNSPDDADDNDDLSQEAQSDGDFKGYVPATERTWIHPSEYSLSSIGPPQRSHKRTTAIFAMAASLIAIVVGASVLVGTRRSNPPTVALTAMTAPDALPAVMKAALASSVTISASSKHAVEQMNGLAIAPNAVATTAVLPRGSTVRIVEANGTTIEGTVVANDSAMDLSVAETAKNLAVAIALPVAEGARRGTGGFCDLKAGCRTVSIKDANQTLVNDKTPLSLIRSSTTGVGQAGDLLVTERGAVVGVSDPALGQDEFMPSWLFKQEALHLLETKSASHGYLGIDVADATPTGAKVTALQANGAAQGHLDVGDVVTAVDGQLVHSMAQLIDVLYSIPARAVVDLGFVRHGQGMTTNVTLASSP